MDMEFKKTKKKLKIFYTIFFSIFLIIPLGIYVYFQYQFSTLEKQTLHYLYDNGYQDDNLKDVNTTFQYGSRFVTKIIFLDEPQITYEFVYRYNEIILLDPQSRDDEYEYKHWDENGLKVKNR